MSYDYSGSTIDKTDPRQYAVVLYLPKHLDDAVTPLRERFDPDYNLVAAHITVVFPFATSQPLTVVSAALRAEVRQIEPIQIELESVGDFYPDVPVIYWQVKENPALNALYKRLYAALEMPIPYRTLIPHVTLAREISAHRVVLVKDTIAAYLTHEIFIAEFIDLVSPVADNHWVSVRSFPLQAAGPAG
ncbi:MAG: 2'-5' RNA ligase family protein [candidate division Zixibacteria bacterium]|nr:2'-5' RNA ligase family protein [candidate division Zixibacteria bacterium]